MSKWMPRAGEHSIQEAAIAVHSEGELEPQQIELTRGRVHADLNVDFGRSQEIRGGNINIDMGIRQRLGPYETLVSGVHMSMRSSKGAER